jgi:hypothetical protein
MQKIIGEQYMPLRYLDNSTDASTVIQALRRDGAVVVKNVAEHDVVDTIVNELRTPLDNDDLVIDVANDILLPHCSNGQCAAWVDTSPVPEWRDARGQIGSVDNAKAQSGE